MPKTHRDLLKRQIAHAHNNLDLAIDHIAQVAIQFESVHPELEEGLVIASSLINQADEVLKAFVMAAWGREDVEWETWRNVGTRTRAELQLEIDRSAESQDDDDEIED